MATNYLNKTSLSQNIRDKNLKDKELVDIVNKAGRVIGKVTRSEVYKVGLLHPAVNIIVVNKEGEIFIQKRGPGKIYPLHWDISVSEHVKSGEEYKLAAVRGLAEELSIVASVKLLRKKHLQKNEYIKEQQRFVENELVELYGAAYDGKIEINKDEVAEGKYISLKQLYELIKNSNLKFTPWGLDELNYLFDNQSIISEVVG